MTTEGTGLAAAVFDMDGLLVDSEPLWREAEVAVFGRYGVALSAESCRSTKGMFVAEVARHWHAVHPWSGPTPDEVADEIVEAVADLLCRRATLLPGARHALRFCRSRVPHLALASSSPIRLIEVVVDRFGLGSTFDVVRSAESEPAGKPDPALFLSTAAALGVAPGRCVVFEDSPAGVAAALAAGMRCVAVPERRAGDGLDGLRRADVVLTSLAELDAVAWRTVEGRVAAPQRQEEHMSSDNASSIYDIPINTLQGEPSSLAAHKGKALLLVNVASRCGLTPQYAGLQRLQDEYGEQGFSVLGFPCNQFLEQEPGTPDEIATFCSVNYGVTFPLFEKIEVNGPGRHPLYGVLTDRADADGQSGDVQWNFEKFLVSSDGDVIGRFRPGVEPEDPTLVAALEAALPA